MNLKKQQMNIYEPTIKPVDKETKWFTKPACM